MTSANNQKNKNTFQKVLICLLTFCLLSIICCFYMFFQTKQIGNNKAKISELSYEVPEIIENINSLTTQLEDIKKESFTPKGNNQIKNQITALDHLTADHEKKINFLSQRITKNETDTNNQAMANQSKIKKKPNKNPEIKLTDLSKCPSFDQLIGFKAEREAADRFLTFLKNFEDFQGIGSVDTPTGLLLYGVAGTGKTTFAQALAKEANLPFFDISSSSFSKGIIGEAPKLVRDLFETARAEAQETDGAIIFIDECEEIFKNLAGDQSTFNKDTANVVNEFKAQMTSKDNDPAKPIFVIGATNHLNKIDEAIKSRFSYVIEIRPGNLEERKQMLNFLIQKRKNPYSDEAKDYLLNVVNKSLEYLPMYKRSNRTLTNLLKEIATTFALNRKKETPKRTHINKDDIKHAYHLRVHHDTKLLDTVEEELKKPKEEPGKQGEQGSNSQ